jgi:hypothetical protein
MEISLNLSEVINAPATYESDFYGWTSHQAQILHERNWEALDIANLIEEIESLGRQERRELENRLGVLVGHLLKWQYQPKKKSKSWKLTIRGQRQEIAKLLLDNPSLKPYLPDALQRSYSLAINLVLGETSLKLKELPEECLYTITQVLDPTYPTGIEDNL